MVLARLGEYGSVVQPLIGSTMALLGAGTHALLSASCRFRRLAFWRRGVLNWTIAYVPFLTLAGTLLNFKAHEHDPNVWSNLAKLLLLDTGMPMLLVALLVAAITSSGNESGEA